MGVESEGGCRSDRRERRTSELKGKRGEKGDIIAERSYRVDKRGVRAVGQARGVSEADETMCIMYVHERAAPGFVAKGLARTLSVSCWLHRTTPWPIVRTSQNAKCIKVAPTEV